MYISAAVKSYLYHFVSIRRPCWFCHKLSKLRKSEEHSWTCDDCGQYNGFSVDGSYNRDIPEMHDESLNVKKFTSNADKDVPVCNGLCYSCNRNQELKIYQLASFSPLNEATYDEELANLRARLESAYRLCVFCERTARDKIKMQDQWLKNHLPKENSPKKPQKKTVLPMLGDKFNSVILTAPKCIKLLLWASAIAGVVISFVDVPCFLERSLLEEIRFTATVEAIRENRVALGILGIIFVLGCFGLISWKHQFRRVDFFLLSLWVSLVSSLVFERPESLLECSTTSYIQSSAALLVAILSMWSSSVNRIVLLRQEKPALERNSPEAMDESVAARPEKKIRETRSVMRSESPEKGVLALCSSASKKGSPSSISSWSSVAPSDSASQIRLGDNKKYTDNLPKPVKLFDRLDDRNIDTGISSLKIGSPLKRNQYFVPNPTNFLSRSGSTATRSLFSGTKPVLSPPRFRPASKTGLWLGNIAQINEFRDFSDFHNFNSSQPISRSSSQSSGFASCADLGEKTLLPEFGTPSPSLSRRSSISDLTEVSQYRGNVEPWQSSRRQEDAVCSSSALALRSEIKDRSLSRLSDYTQMGDTTAKWSWVPFVLGFSVAVNMCGLLYLSVLK